MPPAAGGKGKRGTFWKRFPSPLPPDPHPLSPPKLFGGAFARWEEKGNPSYLLQRFQFKQNRKNYLKSKENHSSVPTPPPTPSNPLQPGTVREDSSGPIPSRKDGIGPGEDFRTPPDRRRPPQPGRAQSPELPPRRSRTGILASALRPSLLGLRDADSSDKALGLKPPGRAAGGSPRSDSYGFTKNLSPGRTSGLVTRRMSSSAPPSRTTRRRWPSGVTRKYSS